MNNIPTVYHYYRFPRDTAASEAEYHAFHSEMIARGFHLFAAAGGSNDFVTPDLDGATIELETAHIFDNQWNSAPLPGISEKGARLFDWCEPIHYNYGRETKAKSGYWLEQTQAMRDIRAHTLKCGFCDKQYGPDREAPPADGFCNACIDSQYLKSTDLHLLRLTRCDVPFGATRVGLTDMERAKLMPRYTEAQLIGNSERSRKRIAKMRADIANKASKAMRDADIESKGMLWVLDHLGPNLVDNCIYYDHTGRFCFGWRTPLDHEITSQVVDAISEFPYPYDLKSASRGTLSGG